MKNDNSTSVGKLFSNSLIYTVVGILAKGIHFFLLPIYTVYLTTSDYGIQNMVVSFNSVMTYVVLMSLDSAVLKFCTEYKDEKEVTKRIYGTAISLVAILSGIVFIFFLLLKDCLSTYILKGIDFFPYILLGYFILIFDAFYSLHKRMLEMRQEAKKLSVVSVISILFSTGVTLLMIVIFREGAVGLLFAGMLASFGTLIFMIVDIRKNNMAAICLDIPIAKKMLKYSIPLIPHQASGYIATLISKIFLNNTSSLATIGVYGIASQFSNIIDVFQDSASHAYRPWIFEKLKNPESIDKIEIKNSILLLLTAYTLVYGVVGLFSQEILYIMTAEEYHKAWKVVPILVIYFSLKSIYYLYADRCLYYKNTSNKLFMASITGSLCNIVAAYFLVPVFGLYGTSIAMIISIIVLNILTVAISKRGSHIDVGYRLKLMLERLLIAWIFIGIGIAPSYIFWSNKINIRNIAYKLVVAFVYLMVIWIMNRNIIKSFWGTGSIAEIIKKVKASISRENKK